MKRYSIKKKVLAATVLIWAGYAILTSFAPLAPGANRYGMSDGELFLVRVSIAVPILVIWLLAGFGAAAFRDYATSLADSRDGKGMRLVANGLLLIVLGMVLPSFLTSSQNYSTDPGIVRGVSLIGSYLQVIIPLCAQYLIFRGASELVGMTKGEKTYQRSQRVIQAVGAFLAAIYMWAYLAAGPKIVVSRVGLSSLPFLLVFATVAVPTVLTWYFGITGASGINIYARHVKGSIYRQILHKLVQGIGGVIGVSILIQVVTVLGPAISSWSLGAVLIFVYALLALLAAAFLMIARGARNLRRIEEVV